MRRSFLLKYSFLLSFALLNKTGFCSDFTALYPGARASAMGSAFASVADDPYAIFYNPAGIVQMRNIELASGMARRRTPQGDLAQFSMGYVRPLPFKEKAVFSSGYEAIRNSTLGNRDTFLFGYSDTLTLKYLQLPMLWGANFRIISLRYPGKSHFGIGADAGLIFRSISKIRTGLVLSDINTGMGRSFATLTLANSYKYENTLFALDLRIRGGYAEFFPGIEHYLYNKLLSLRVGKGVNVNGKDYLAMGLGYNLDPLNLNFLFSLPWDGFKEKAGAYEIGFTYKFGGKNFSEKMVEEAANRLAELNSSVEALDKQRSQLDIDVTRYQTSKGVLQSDVTILQSRMLELNEKVRQLEIEAIDAQFKKENPPAKHKVIIPKEVWPKFHKVQTGDTLRSIAGKYYGNQNLWQLIYDANENKVYKGLPMENTTLKIPPPVER